MVRSTAALLLVLLAAASCDACGARRAPGGSASSSLATERASTREPFTPPAGDGWGQAAGLHYLERTLAGGDPTQPLPMVIMIHGMGDAPRADWFTAAGEIKTPMRLIMPRAPTPYYDGFSWFAYDPQKRDPELLARGIAAAAAQLARAVELLRVRRPTRGRPVVTGFSQGGMLSYALALHYPELVAFSHPISGTLPEPLWPREKPEGKRFPRIAAMHGDRDQLVPIALTRRLHERLSALGFDNSLREFPGVGHQISAEMEAQTVELLESAVRASAQGND
jgi:phospholipase/carboxylesterase